ncbi:Beta-fructosidase [Devosia equisanguinis]|uniref:beta-fructofuranosidase n=1 Tax=Devosia equisanguinis TaxID=2490941 RepID=A0A3S4CQR5_9HYPH|nr:hypothetical protein [Devosia equisanguinis]VDS03920.1 Beta-fructosidase [Devosia equisanguinis]
MRSLLAALLLGTCASVQAAPLYFAGETAGVGDPNPFYEDGTYSVFYLQNQGRHPWFMSQSSDLGEWSQPVETVPVGEAGAPDYWTGSGSVIADPKGGYRLYYTGHDPEGRPKEVTMEARSATLAGPWTKIPETTFAGLPSYDEWDFRDPFVFWNEDADAWWMLLTTRHDGKAAIGLYTSPDLGQWAAADPIYAEESPLNLEVPDLFSEGDDWFLLYSDQRDNARQVRYLTAETSVGPYAYGAYDALDGRGFYAGKSAGTGDERLLFGWVAHKNLRKDAMNLVWGGDLIMHALKRADDGALAVSLPKGLANQFDTARVTLSPENLEIGTPETALRARAALSVEPGTRFGLSFTATNSGRVSTLEIDTTKGEAAFLYNGDPSGAPRVAFPPSADGAYTLDLVIDPDLGLGVLYINDFRALSFRYYRVGATTVSLFADDGFATLDGTVSLRSTDRTEEKPNG